MKACAATILIHLSLSLLQPGNSLFSQVSSDSLLQLLETAQDTAKVRILRELSWENRHTHPADALKYGLQALELARELDMFEEEASTHNYLGVIQRNVGDHATALEYFFNAQRLAEEHGIDHQLAYSYNNIGDIYNLEDNSAKALEYELRALKIFEDVGDSVGVSYCCHQIARAYTNLEQYALAIQYYTRSMEIRDYQGNRTGLGYSLISIGETYLSMGELAVSLESLLRSGEIFTELKDDIGLSGAYYSLGMYYRHTGDSQNAIHYLNESLELGRETSSPIRIRNAAQVLSEIYAEKDSFEEAYQMYILFKETYDSLYQEENLVKITQLVMQHEFEQRELLQLAEIARQKQFRNYLIILSGLGVILVMVILSRYHIKRKANLDLQAKNREIESQKKKLENLFVSLRIKNDELSQQNDEIITQKDHLSLLNHELEQQKFELNKTLHELTQAQTHLVQSEKMASLGQLTAGVAHELNNPINFISASIKPLQRNVEDLLSLLERYDEVIRKKDLLAGFAEVEEMKQSVDLDYAIQETRSLFKGLAEGSTRSMQIVKDLRTFSRMDENVFKPFDIHDGIDSTLLLLHHKMENRIRVHKQYGKIPHVECLPGKLNQVFMNILTNSIQAIDGEGEIFVETSGTKDRVKISIRDTGIGMAREVRDHVFEPFFTTRTVGEGTGLGLSISYSIIQEHAGTIEVASEPGEGTEFIIILPFSRTEQQ
jgi:signal transduction histidine kinase